MIVVAIRDARSDVVIAPAAKRAAGAEGYVAEVLFGKER